MLAIFKTNKNDYQNLINFKTGTIITQKKYESIGSLLAAAINEKIM